jgi:hypothetical protein
VLLSSPGDEARASARSHTVSVPVCSVESVRVSVQASQSDHSHRGLNWRVQIAQFGPYGVRAFVCCHFGLPDGLPSHDLLLCGCGCRHRFLDRTLVSGADHPDLEDLDSFTIARIGDRLSVRSDSNERRDQTNKCGNDMMRSGAKIPHRGVSLIAEHPGDRRK